MKILILLFLIIFIFYLILKAMNLNLALNAQKNKLFKCLKEINMRTEGLEKDCQKLRDIYYALEKLTKKNDGNI